MPLARSPTSQLTERTFLLQAGPQGFSAVSLTAERSRMHARSLLEQESIECHRRIVEIFEQFHAMISCALLLNIKDLFDYTLSKKDIIEYMLWVLGDAESIDSVKWVNRLAYSMAQNQQGLKAIWLNQNALDVGHVDFLNWLLEKCNQLLEQVRKNNGRPDRAMKELERALAEVSQLN